MLLKERIFHAVLFEFVALIFIIPTCAWAVEKDVVQVTLMGIALSLFTVLWNYAYNLGFDKLFGSDRTIRRLAVRIFHSMSFEIGLIFFTVPAIAWFIDISLMQALTLELSFLVFFLFYTLVFNWVYDKSQPFQHLQKLIPN